MKNRSELIRQLGNAKDDLLACMGGVDPHGAIEAAKRITAIRAALRDTPALIEHLAVLAHGGHHVRKTEV